MYQWFISHPWTSSTKNFIKNLKEQPLDFFYTSTASNTLFSKMKTPQSWWNKSKSINSINLKISQSPRPSDPQTLFWLEIFHFSSLVAFYWEYFSYQMFVLNLLRFSFYDKLFSSRKKAKRNLENFPPSLFAQRAYTQESQYWVCQHKGWRS